MQKNLSQAELSDSLAQLLADLMESATGTRPDVIDRDASFTSYGLDSLAMVTFVAQIEETIGIELEPELAFNYPTLNALAKFIGNNAETESA